MLINDGGNKKKHNWLWAETFRLKWSKKNHGGSELNYERQFETVTFP